MQILKIAIVLCVSFRRAEPLNTNVWFYHSDNSNSRRSHLQRGYKTSKPFLLTPVTSDYKSSSSWNKRNMYNYDRIYDLPSAPQNYYPMAGFLPMKTGNIHRQQVRVDNLQYKKINGKLLKKHSLAKISPDEPQRRKSEDYLFKHLFTDKNEKAAQKKKTTVSSNINNKLTINNLHHINNNITIKYSQELSTPSLIPYTTDEKPNSALSRPQTSLPNKFYNTTAFSTEKTILNMTNTQSSLKPIVELSIDTFFSNFVQSFYHTTTEQPTNMEDHKYFYDFATENTDYLTDEIYQLEGIPDVTENTPEEELLILQDIFPLSKYSSISDDDVTDSEEVTPPNTIQRIYDIIQTFGDSLTEKTFIGKNLYNPQTTNNENNTYSKYTTLGLEYDDQENKKLTTNKPDEFKIDSAGSSEYFHINTTTDNFIQPLNDVYEKSIPIINNIDQNITDKNSVNLDNYTERLETIDLLDLNISLISSLRNNNTAYDEDDSIKEYNITELSIKNENNISVSNLNTNLFRKLGNVETISNESRLYLPILSPKVDIDENPQTSDQKIAAKQNGKDSNINTTNTSNHKQNHYINSYSYVNPHKFNIIDIDPKLNNVNQSLNESLPKLTHVMKEKTSTKLKTTSTVSYSLPENYLPLNKTVTEYAKDANLIDAEFQTVDPDLYLYRDILSSNFDNDSSGVSEDDSLRDLDIFKNTNRMILNKNVTNKNIKQNGFNNSYGSDTDKYKPLHIKNENITEYNSVTANNSIIKMDMIAPNFTFEYEKNKRTYENTTHLSADILIKFSTSIGNTNYTTKLPINMLAKSNDIAREEFDDQENISIKNNNTITNKPATLLSPLSNRSDLSIVNNRLEGNMSYSTFNMQNRVIDLLSNLDKVAVPILEMEMFEGLITTDEPILLEKSNNVDETTINQFISKSKADKLEQTTTWDSNYLWSDVNTSTSLIVHTTESTQDDFYFVENSHNAKNYKAPDIFPVITENKYIDNIIKHKSSLNETSHSYGENDIPTNDIMKETSHKELEQEPFNMNSMLGEDSKLNVKGLNNLNLQKEYFIDDDLSKSVKSSNDSTILNTEDKINNSKINSKNNESLGNISHLNQSDIFEERHKNTTRNEKKVSTNNVGQLYGFGVSNDVEINLDDAEFRDDGSTFQNIDSDINNSFSSQIQNSDILNSTVKNKSKNNVSLYKDLNREAKLPNSIRFTITDNINKTENSNYPTISENISNTDIDYQTSNFNNTDHGSFFNEEDNIGSQRNLTSISNDTITKSKNKTSVDILTSTVAETTIDQGITKHVQEESTTRSFFLISSMQEITSESQFILKENTTDKTVPSNNSVYLSEIRMHPKSAIIGISNNIGKRQEHITKPYKPEVNVSGNNNYNPINVILDPRHRRSDITVEEDNSEYYDLLEDQRNDNISHR